LHHDLRDTGKVAAHQLCVASTLTLHVMQGFIAGALEAEAIEAAPVALTLTGILESYDADVLSGPAANYITDRFLQSIPEDLIASLVTLYSNATSPYSTILIEAPVSAFGGSNNSDTAFGFRGEWYVEVWPFWERTAGGAAVDGERIRHSCCMLRAKTHAQKRQKRRTKSRTKDNPEKHRAKLACAGFVKPSKQAVISAQQTGLAEE